MDSSAGDNDNFIGALIALGAAIFSAANNIVMAKLGRSVATSIQVPDAIPTKSLLICFSLYACFSGLASK